MKPVPGTAWLQGTLLVPALSPRGGAYCRGRTTEQRILSGGYPPGHEKRVHTGAATDGLSGGHLGEVLAQIPRHTRYDVKGGRSADLRMRDAVVAVAEIRAIRGDAHRT